MPSRPARFRPESLIRLAMLATMTFAGLAIVPTEGADVHLERPKPRVQMPAADRWRLRPAEPALAITTGSIRKRSEIAIPAERRNVRLVYPALLEAR